MGRRRSKRRAMFGFMDEVSIHSYVNLHAFFSFFLSGLGCGFVDRKMTLTLSCSRYRWCTEYRQEREGEEGEEERGGGR